MISCDFGRKFAGLCGLPFVFLLLSTGLLILSAPLAHAQISITATGASYSENFDGMGPLDSNYVPGWTGVRYAGTGTIGATLVPRVGNGSGNSGLVYNLGSSGASDRALGMLASGSTVPRIGAQYVNNTGVTITTINFAGVMEQWRTGDNAVVETDAFEYSLNATSLMTGTWTAATGMDLIEKLTTSATANAVDGNQSANRTNISATVSGLSWTNGTTLWIRWSDVNNTGTDGTLAIDNLTMSFNIVLAPPGKGTASAAPALIQGAVSSAVTMTVRGQSSYTLTNTNVTIPSGWTWSHSAADVTLTGGGSPTKTVSGDTVKVSNMSVVGTDSILITINNLTPPDSTDNFTFFTQTGTQPDSILTLTVQPSVLVYGTPHAIGDIKANDANGVPVWSGKYVTILGVVTVGAEFGSPSYIQDATGGIAVFGVITSGQISVGDEVEIVGLVSPFNGLTELNSPTIIKKVSSGNVVTPLPVTCGQVTHDGTGGFEQYEGRLVRINQVIVTSLNGSAIANWTVSGSGTNYRLQDAGDTLQIRVDNSVNFANGPAPSGTFDVIGVVSQFKNTSPFIGGYQLMPRSSADILAQGPIFATSPVESNLQPTSFRISWTTLHGGTTRLRYGLTTGYELGLLAPDNLYGLSHVVDVTGLTPATIYHVQAFSDSGATDTSFAADLIVSTASPVGSTGQINVYFNKSVNTSVSTGENALGSQDLVSRVVTRINNAHRSIDLALYSLSANAQGDVIANALINARNRGVSVRVICEYDNSNSAGSSFPTLVSAGIPLITDRFDAVWFGAGLSHNKFFIFDYQGGAPESVWVWGGSWNPTNSGTTQDRQNSIEIQDVALAGAYTAEFNEMWGSSTQTPNSANSRFGARKTNNTPHNFNVNGVPVSSYFSPSDQTTSHLTSTIAKAQSSVSTAILTFTRKDIADAIIGRKNAGAKTRIVVDNNTDQGNQFTYLSGAGVDIHLKGGSGLLHHKYTVVDGDQAGGTGYLMTGSHNYSNSAEQSNDENTLILKNNRVANLYLQEFAARYYEAGGTDSIHVTSAAGFTISRSSINYDTVLTTQSKTDSFTVTNTGNLPLVIAPIQRSNVEFTVQPESATVAGSGTQKFYVTFSPANVGPRAGNLVLTFNATGSPDTVLLSGVGKSGLAPVYSATPTSLNIGEVNVGSSKQDSFTVSNSGTASLNVSGVTSTNAGYAVLPTTASISPSSSQVFVVTFAPTDTGTQNGSIILTHNAAGSPDTIVVTGKGKDTSTAVTVSTNVLPAWNMLSVPVQVSDLRRATLYPTATSSAFIYRGRYITRDTLEYGVGVWLKFPSGQSISHTGVRLTRDTVTVPTGWSMIGSLTNPIPTNSILQIPSGIVRSNYFAYESIYIARDTLKPGKAYWVKTSQAGKLVLASSGNVPKIVGPSPVEISAMSTLTITDASGRKQTLFVGRRPDHEVSTEMFDLPPTPPEGAFDIRFGSGRSLEFYSKEMTQAIQLPIRIQSAHFPIMMSWSIDCQDRITYTLLTGVAGNRKPLRLDGKGETVVNDLSDGGMSLAITPDKPLPEEFSLGQNYPNPFNPRTVIPFALPHAARVTMTVFNLLGEVMATPIDRQEFDAGYHTVEVDASQLSSGVYFYRVELEGMSVPTFTTVKKLVVLK